MVRVAKTYWRRSSGQRELWSLSSAQPLVSTVFLVKFEVKRWMTVMDWLQWIGSRRTTHVNATTLHWRSLSHRPVTWPVPWRWRLARVVEAATGGSASPTPLSASTSPSLASSSPARRGPPRRRSAAASSAVLAAPTRRRAPPGRR